MRAGQLDLAFSDTTVRDGSLEVEELIADDYVVIAPTWSPLVERDVDRAEPTSTTRT